MSKKIITRSGFKFFGKLGRIGKVYAVAGRKKKATGKKAKAAPKRTKKASK